MMNSIKMEKTNANASDTYLNGLKLTFKNSVLILTHKTAISYGTGNSFLLLPSTS